MNKRKIMALMMAGVMMFSVTACGGSDAPKEEPKDEPVAEEQEMPKQYKTYKEIYDEFSKKLRDATPGLIAEYNKESQGISDINKLATISNKKIQKLALISNKGIEEMAQLMYRNGDDQDVYEDWAMELTNVYEECGMEITNAYTESAMQ